MGYRAAETMQVDHDILTFDLLDGATTIAAIGKSTNQQGAVNCQFAPFELTAPLTADPATSTCRSARPRRHHADQLLPRP